LSRPVYRPELRNWQREWLILEQGAAESGEWTLSRELRLAMSSGGPVMARGRAVRGWAAAGDKVANLRVDGRREQFIEGLR
jgi:hypothetical protein